MTEPKTTLRPAIRTSINGMIFVFAALFILSWIFVKDFGSWGNISGLLLSVATVGMIACTMMFCLASGDFDLSVGSVVAAAGVVAAEMTSRTGNIGIGILSGLAVGLITGFFNGFIIAVVGINALITTLATMQIVRGAGFIISNGRAVSITEAKFATLGNTFYFGIQTPTWLMFFAFLVFGVLLNKTTFGRNTLAIGGNTEAARLAGIPVNRTKIVIFTLQGLMAAFAGVVLAARFTSGQPNTSVGLELQVISACVLGGVSLTGGIATISGVVVGVLIMGTVQNVMNLMNVDTFYQLVASGAILLAAVLFDRFKQRRAA